MDNIAKDKQGTIQNWANSWESRAKLIAAICYIFGVISLESPHTLFIAYTLALFLFLLIRISFFLLLKRYLIITPFLLLMTIPLLWQYSVENAIFSIIIIMKAYISMTVITIVLETQSLDDLINGLAGLKLPPILITILILSYRYVFLFLDDIERMITATKSRFFHGGIRINSLKVYGHLIASLLFKAIQRSEKMHEAMVSRGFTGSLTFQNTNTPKLSDIFKSCFAISIIIFLIVLEKCFII
ncbi:cobalt ECF transporter T component CbiQ [Ornithinibacillus salinisoli]|uniref:Cobalt ECF transporter T component CbiQ n=1 Tax=Ornithinibacillus salinisoli TaxID=1848459 RepID=A0ABW4VYZ9_9BACI